MSQYTYQNYDIDLDALDQETDQGIVADILQRVVNADSDFKIFPARQWIENFLYFAGVREVFNKFGTGTVIGNSLLSNFSLQGGNPFGSQYRRRIAKTFKACQIVAANITRERPSVKVWPESDDEVSTKKAKLANILLDYLWDEDKENDMYYEAVLWSLLTPLVARKDIIDYSFNKTRIWPRMIESVNPYTGEPITDVQRDEMGNPILDQHPWNKSELIPAFRLFFNPSASSEKTFDFIGDISIKRMKWIEQFNRNEPGYHPENLHKIKKGAAIFTPIMAVEASIKQLTFGIFRAYRNFNYQNNMLKDGVTAINFYTEPTSNYPEGREIVTVNNIVLYDGASRVYNETSNRWHTYATMCYERVPGRAWGTTYAEKITDINRAYEQARTEFDQLRRTFSKPKMRLPIGCNIDRDTVTGDEQIYRYNPFGPDGGKPDYLQVPNPPSVIMDDIKMTADEFVEISGVTEIQQGIRPQGVSTFRGLEILREESNNAQSNLIRMYEDFIQNSQINKLENIRQCLQLPDQKLVNAIRIFKKMNQYITDIDVQQFIGDDLAGYVKIEPMSSIGKSKLGLQEKYMSMAQMGVLGDIVTDPELNNEFKRKMDVTGFDQPQNRQVTYARWENQMMLSAQDKGMPINPPVYPWHDDVIHIRECENLLLDPTLMDKQLILESVMAHREQHMQQMAQKQAQAAANAALGMQPPGPGGPQGGQEKPLNKGRNSPTMINNQPPKPNEGTLFGPETGFASSPEVSLA